MEEIKYYEIDNDYYKQLNSMRIHDMNLYLKNIHKDYDWLLDRIIEGNINEVKKILDEKPYLIAFRSEPYYTPIEFAAIWGQNEIINLIMDKYKNLDAKSRAEVMFWCNEYEVEQYNDIIFGNNPRILVLWAIENGQIDTLKYLYSKFPKIKYEKCFLERAAEQTNSDVTKFVMEQAEKNGELNFNEECKQGSSHITIVETAACSGNIEIIKKALEKKSLDPNKVSRFEGYTLLHFAAENGNIDLVKLLIENGGNIHAKDKYGNTPANLATKELKDLEESIYTFDGKEEKKANLINLLHFFENETNIKKDEEEREKKELEEYINKREKFFKRRKNILKKREQLLQAMEEQNFPENVIDDLKEEIKARKEEIEIREREIEKLNKLKESQKNQFGFSVNYLKECKKIYNKEKRKRRWIFNYVKNTRKEIDNFVIKHNKSSSKINSLLPRSKSYNDINKELENQLLHNNNILPVHFNH